MVRKNIDINKQIDQAVRHNALPMRPIAFLRYMLSFQNFAVMVGGCVLMDLAEIIVKLLLAYVIGDVVGVVQHNGTSPLSWALFHDQIVFLAFISIFLLITNYAGPSFWRQLTTHFRAFINQYLFTALIRKKALFFINNHTGHIASRILEISSEALSVIDSFIYSILRVIATIIVGVAFIFYANIYIGLAAMIMAVIFSAFCIKRGLAIGELGGAHAHKIGQVNGHIVDIITNIFNVFIFAQKRDEQSRVKSSLDQSIKTGLSLHSLQRKTLCQSTFLTLIFLLTMLYLIIQAMIAGYIDLPKGVTLITLTILIFNSMEDLSFRTRLFMQSVGALQDGLETLDLNNDISIDNGTAVLKGCSQSITFSAIHFHYDGLNSPDQNQIIFRDLNLNIKSGEKIGLIGASGAGKSTLVNLLLRFYDIQSGAITIDGQNIADVTQDSLRQQIALIPQDTSLFHRSLMDNIRYGRLDARDEDVIEAAKKAHAHEFIAALPDGYNTMVGERGVKLSGGQRQRIAIARAILKDAPILILDEATSALDSESEKLIQDSLQDLMKGKTVIAIAHRLSTIAHLDRLIVMDKGQIIEDGRHKDLLKKKDGLYTKLWTMQSGGFLGE